VILWRISNHASVDGAGALKTSGRWHSRGRRVVYCAESPAAALLEILVHLEIELPDLPARYRLLKIELPDDASRERIGAADLPPDWIDNPIATRAAGDAWLREARSLLLAVPSAIVPSTENVLINPAHPEAAGVRLVETSEHVIDPRLVT
jgi:RES domain-containing protein